MENGLVDMENGLVNMENGLVDMKSGLFDMENGLVDIENGLCILIVIRLILRGKFFRCTWRVNFKLNYIVKVGF